MESASGPTVSTDVASGKTPSSGMRPWVTLSPKHPHSAAGTRTEPPVSVPMATGVMPAATAAAEPPEDPPGDVSGSHGLRTGPKWGFSDEKPNANSWRPVRPITTAPAASSRLTTGEDRSASWR